MDLFLQFFPIKMWWNYKGGAGGPKPITRKIPKSESANIINNKKKRSEISDNSREEYSIPETLDPLISVSKLLGI